MTAPTFVNLLRPGGLGPLTLSSRIVLPAMDMNHCVDGEITEAEIAHYRARAEGGAALVITGSSAVAFPVGAASRKQPGLSDDRFLPGLTRLASAVHDAGSLLCVQLTHHGKTARVDIAAERDVLVPSVPHRGPDMASLRDCTPDEVLRLAATTKGKAPTFAVADDEDLAWLVHQFAAATRRVREAGAAAVEVHAGHGYVLSSFLAAADNRRDDAWGGPLENRARLTLEVVRAVRRAAGPDMAVIVRLSGREHGDPEGITLDETVSVARWCAEAGADAIHVTGFGRNPFVDFTEGPLPSSVGAYRDDALAVRQAVDVPVIAVGRVLPELAEEMVAGGECDFVAMGRQLLTDPELVAKLRAGRRTEIRPCISCYVCVEQNFYDDPPRCAVNPALGEEELARVRPADPVRHVVVVGGGPGGMEVARVCAERGHRVTVLEASGRLGGTAWFSQLTTPANGPFVEWQGAELARLGVAVRCSTVATRDVVAAIEPDVVVIATGAERGALPVPGGDRPHVWTGDDLRAALADGRVPRGRALGAGGRAAVRAAAALRITRDAARVRRLSRRWLPLGKRVAVIGGGLVGLELAEFLAERGRAVTVLEPGPAAGLPMAAPRRWAAIRDATRHGVVIVRQATVVEVTDRAVVYDVSGERTELPVDSVVIASEVRAGAPLVDELRQLDVPVHVVGDAAEVGYIEGAVRSAWQVARAI